MTSPIPSAPSGRARVHVFLFIATVVAAAAWPVPAAAQASAPPFQGLYAGVDVGRQQLIGGSLVDGVDTLQEDGRLVTSAFGGLRAQVAGFVLGGELGLGLADGNLQLVDPDRGLTVDYRSRRQWHWALTAGHAVGSRTLLFAYVSEVTRRFDVTIDREGALASQDDEQGLLRFGGGVERRLGGPFGVRVTAGTSRADFGGRPTNIAPGRRLEVSAGVVVQF
ncbi:MAG: hypothetical protein AB7H88_11145 [Vicinamibacterales bacterium]